MSKFCYEEGEIRFADCQCEFCIYYNNGERSSECPKELLDKITITQQEQDKMPYGTNN